jgi:uncharacterized protein YndB with AHSA1/START domain/predicted enzyme related to lactoylglutathione lyase
MRTIRGRAIPKISLMIVLMILSASSFADSPPAKIPNVGAVAINPCQDAKILADWYSKFGIETKEYQGGYYAQLGTTDDPFFFAIHPKKADAPARCSASISVVFHFKDFDTSLSAAKSKGLSPYKTEEDPNEGRFAHFHDPDGNEVTIWGGGITVGRRIDMTRAPLIFTYYIAAPIDRVWDGFVSKESNQKIFLGADFEVDLRPGGAMTFSGPDKDGKLMRYVTGEVLRVEKPKLFEYKFGVGDGKVMSKVKVELTPETEAVKVVVTNDNFAEDDPAYAQSADGWPRILSRLKTLLETGKTFRPH